MSAWDDIPVYEGDFSERQMVDEHGNRIEYTTVSQGRLTFPRLEELEVSSSADGAPLEAPPASSTSEESA